MMKQAQSMQQKMQKEMDELLVDASAGGGVVTVQMKGNHEIMALKIDPEGQAGWHVAAGAGRTVWVTSNAGVRGTCHQTDRRTKAPAEYRTQVGAAARVSHHARARGRSRTSDWRAARSQTEDRSLFCLQQSD